MMSNIKALRLNEIDDLYDKPVSLTMTVYLTVGPTMTNKQPAKDTLTVYKQECDEKLLKLQDRLEELFACNQFYRESVEAITYKEEFEDEPWHIGLLFTGKRLEKIEQKTLDNLVKIRETIENE